MTRLISFAVLIAIIIIIGLLFYRVLIGFFIPVFLACVLVVVFRPLHNWVLQKIGHRDRIAAVVTTLLIILILFLPILVVGSTAATQGLRLIKANDASTVYLRLMRLRDSLGLQLPPYNDQLRQITDEIGLMVETANESTLDRNSERLSRLADRTIQLLQRLRDEVEEIEGPRWESEFKQVIELADAIREPDENDETAFAASKKVVELKTKFANLRTDLLGGGMMALARERANPTREEINELVSEAFGYFQPRLLSITGATGSFLVKLIFGAIIMVVATFFFLYDGPSMVKSVMYLSPLDDSYEQELLLEFDRISRAVVLATLLSAIVQGLTAGLGYAVVGMDYLALLIMLTTVFAMVPFVGPAVVWVPVCLYVGLYEERVTAAILLALWGVLVVGTIDNLVKALVLHGQSELHPLLALLSVLGGVQALGPVGIVVGPMVVAMLQTLLSILQRELVHFDESELVLSTGRGGGTSSASAKAARKKTLYRRRKHLSVDDEAEGRAEEKEDEPLAEKRATDESGLSTTDADEQGIQPPSNPPAESQKSNDK